jgi:carbon monoxide dehydrogenase subunit G
LKRARRPIAASTEIAAPAEAVVRFLADLENHVQLAPGEVELLSLERRPDLGDHAVVRLRGPSGIRRTASTELMRPSASSSIIGRAWIGKNTAASVAWRIRPLGAGSAVTLCATIDATSALDGLLLRAGGRRWLTRQFSAALEHLAYQLSTAPALDGGSRIASASRSGPSTAHGSALS